MVLFISIHALLAESDHWYHISKNAAIGFLSTLSLRRATRLWIMLYSCPGNFYPRSPCGERLYSRLLFGRHAAISIHALLAESDRDRGSKSSRIQISIHALLAESDHYDNYNLHCVEISIHALLAESDFICLLLLVLIFLFLSTLSLRRATPIYTLPAAPYAISIHALLAESDSADIQEPTGGHPISIHALLAESDAD